MLLSVHYPPISSRRCVVGTQPLEEYQVRAPGVVMKTPSWTWDEIKNLRIDQLANQPTFLFLWVGCGTGLEKGREAMRAAASTLRWSISTHAQALAPPRGTCTATWPW